MSAETDGERPRGDMSRGKCSAPRTRRFLEPGQSNVIPHSSALVLYMRP